MRNLGVGIIGLGSIGGFVAQQIMKAKVTGAKLIAVADVKSPSESLANMLERNGVSLFGSYHELVDPNIDLIVECANQALVGQCARFFIARGIDMVVMSVGAFADNALFEEVSRLAADRGCKIYSPSGAVGGLDALSAARMEGLEEVILTTRKPPSGLAGVKDLGLDGLTESKLVYEGPATEAVKRFPKNVNVAAAISLAGVGAQRTVVRVVADPNIDRNIHELSVRGEFGSFEMRLRNKPSPQNPRTSYLASLSVLSILQKVLSPVQIGN
jgi:aspartate dehydrogenase